MKALKHISTLLMVFFLSLFLVNCEKVNPEMDLVADPGIEASQLKAAEIGSSAEIDYLMSLIVEIESLADGGVLNIGQANALIVKIENAIKSLEKGNDNAAENQLTAFVSQSEDFVENGILTPEQGESLINTAENAIILSEGGFIDPRDGQVYSVVLIGDQLWMAENLKATKFNDGTDIPLVTDIDSWVALTTPGYCWYNNDYETYNSPYGAMYNWFAVGTGKLSPEGWHVPTDAEVTTLIQYLTVNGYGYEGSGDDVAKSMASTSGWSDYGAHSPGEPGYDQVNNNASGFNGYPGGWRSGPWEMGGNSYHNLSYDGWWWTSSEATIDHSYIYMLRVFMGFVGRFYYEKPAGFSVRCIKD